ncbi:hypothetical protein H4R26_004107 [Coemansia thaxteri]|uniref:Amino acid permease/ SLC12A domain-containing protein n=1 Tax=Coemansia thaxteri TaxID=2663907 RepID=A0A9W8BFJ2_9FUNG|nr:hypothetical protein H4R26_004107 [Coemansia thaxteri]
MVGSLARYGSLRNSGYGDIDNAKPGLAESTPEQGAREDSSAPVVEESGDDEAVEPKTELLVRGLSQRCISFIALGGVIGSGLFIGTGTAISAGPGSALIAYSIVSVIIYFTMTSLGELATYLPIPGSFNAYGTRFVDPAFGFALSWNYWLNWVSTVAYEAGAVAIPISYWLPHVNFAVWGISLMVVVVGINSVAVRGYGEAEFWFALIKIVAICMFIIVGVAVAAGWLGGHHYGFEMWRYGKAPFVGGFGGVLNTFIQAGFSMQGSELVGVVAAESQRPAKLIPRATRQIVFRLAVFFVLSVFLMGLVIPYDDPQLISSDSSDSGVVSPFTIVFLKAGIRPAAHIMSVVMVTSSISACSSGLYAACRTVHVMATQGHAPRVLARTTRRGVPLNALLFCATVTLALWAFNFVGQGIVFVFLTGVSGVAGYLAWASICVVHIRFRMAWRRQGHSLDELRYRAPLYPFGPVFCFVLICVVVFGQAYPSFQNGFDKITFFSSFLELPLFVLLWAVWKWWKGTRVVALDAMDLDSGARGGYTIEEERDMLAQPRQWSLKATALLQKRPHDGADKSSSHRSSNSSQRVPGGLSLSDCSAGADSGEDGEEPSLLGRLHQSQTSRKTPKADVAGQQGTSRFVKRSALMSEQSRYDAVGYPKSTRVVQHHDLRRQKSAAAMRSTPPSSSGFAGVAETQSRLKGFEVRVINTHVGKAVVHAPVLAEPALAAGAVGGHLRDDAPVLPPPSAAELRYNAQRALINTTAVLRSAISGKSAARRITRAKSEQMHALYSAPAAGGAQQQKLKQRQQPDSGGFHISMQFSSEEQRRHQHHQTQQKQKQAGGLSVLEQGCASTASMLELWGMETARDRPGAERGSRDNGYGDGADSDADGSEDQALRRRLQQLAGGAKREREATGQSAEAATMVSRTPGFQEAAICRLPARPNSIVRPPVWLGSGPAHMQTA